jgi:hypothetical protein
MYVSQQRFDRFDGHLAHNERLALRQNEIGAKKRYKGDKAHFGCAEQNLGVEHKRPALLLHDQPNLRNE